GLCWCARAVYARRGVRLTTRTLATLGLGLVAFVAVQRATSPKLLYWYWRPLSANAAPYGPFLNRNSLACWLAMAIPLVISYAVARTSAKPSGTTKLAAIDSTQVWLVGAACLMMGGLLASLSRGGILGGTIGLASMLVLSRPRVRRTRSMVFLAVAIVAMMAVASFYANFGALAGRLQETTEFGEWGRMAIWRDSWRMLADFWLTGIGAGAFERGMLIYQSAS